MAKQMFLSGISSPVKGLLMDINGVLYDNNIHGQPVAIAGSVEAVNRLRTSGIPFRFCTNESTSTTDTIVSKLTSLGFSVTSQDVFAPAPIMRKILLDRGLRPHLLVKPDVLPMFADVDTTDPNCVVLGDATIAFTYDNLNAAFRTLINMKEPRLLSMGAGKYYKEGDGLILDVGPFMKALEFACSVEGEVVGKPSAIFFTTAVKDMDLNPSETLMVGDDIVSDVGGAQRAGLRAAQVRTGKYRACDEPHTTVKPDVYVDNLATIVDELLKNLS